MKNDSSIHVSKHPLTSTFHHTSGFCSLALLTGLLFLLAPNTHFGQTILIDPGHGGIEAGASAKIKLKNGKTKTILEKDLTLILAKKLYRLLDKKYDVYLTRGVDKAVSLLDRAKLADKIKADIFVSIHFNSSRSHQAHGIETYYLDNHNNRAIRKVESVENKGLKGDDRVVNKILIDLAVKLTSKSSKSLASDIHASVMRSVGSRYKVQNRKYRPGLFFVLALAKRPGVLVEAGFMSNPSELSNILSPGYLDLYAKGIHQGLDNYFRRLNQDSLSKPNQKNWAKKKGPSIWSQ